MLKVGDQYSARGVNCVFTIRYLTTHNVYYFDTNNEYGSVARRDFLRDYYKSSSLELSFDKLSDYM